LLETGTSKWWGKINYIDATHDQPKPMHLYASNKISDCEE
jgi:hypothetical protein